MSTVMTEDKTKDVIAEMLVENTGTHMLDSGGASGRAWQRNRKAVGEMSPREFFEAQPVGKFFESCANPYPTHRMEAVDVNTGKVVSSWQLRDGRRPFILSWRKTKLTAGLSPLVNIYHWLSERLEYEPAMDKMWLAWVAEQDEYEGYLSLMERFASEVMHGKGIYGDGTPITVNSYNHDNVLSQDIQYTYWTSGEDDESYVLLQIHGGADIRGGYTQPRLFRVADYDGTSILDDHRCEIACEHCGSHWDLEDTTGYTRDDKIKAQYGQVPALEEYEVHEFTDEAEGRLFAAFHSLHINQHTDEPAAFVFLNINEYHHDSVPLCPVCGIGTLTVWDFPVS